jgi:hypothetical protein
MEVAVNNVSIRRSSMCSARAKARTHGTFSKILQPWCNYHRCVSCCFRAARLTNVNQKPNSAELQNNSQLMNRVYYSQLSGWFGCKLSFLSTPDDRATSVPSQNNASTNDAKYDKQRRYTDNQRRGAANRPEMCPQLMMSFNPSCPRMMTGVNRRQGDKEIGRQGEGKQKARRSFSPLLLFSPSPCLFLPHCQTRPANVKYARSDR